MANIPKISHKDKYILSNQMKITNLKGNKSKKTF